jgi:hypothetical protein
MGEFVRVFWRWFESPPVVTSLPVLFAPFLLPVPAKLVLSSARQHVLDHLHRPDVHRLLRTKTSLVAASAASSACRSDPSPTHPFVRRTPIAGSDPKVLVPLDASSTIAADAAVSGLPLPASTVPIASLRSYSLLSATAVVVARIQRVIVRCLQLVEANVRTVSAHSSSLVLQDSNMASIELLLPHPLPASWRDLIHHSEGQWLRLHGIAFHRVLASPTARYFPITVSHPAPWSTDPGTQWHLAGPGISVLNLVTFFFFFFFTFSSLDNSRCKCAIAI